MGKSKKTADSPPPPPPAESGGLFTKFPGGLGSTRNRFIAAAAIVIAALVAGRVAWNRWGQPSLDDPAFAISPEQIVVTPQPAWIQGDVKAEVIRDSALTDLNLHDKQLLDKVARAFALHSWVAKVKRVEKAYPARLTVDIDYRKPVATVEIGDALGSGEPGLLFIDAESVLLPSDHFSPAQARNYLRISAGNVLPTGVYGTVWGSPRILGAAQIAEAWGDQWKSLGLYRIVIKEDPNAEPIYELHTKGQARVIWGKPPGQELEGEPPAAKKIAYLTQYVAENGSLDKSAGGGPIDLRRLAAPKPIAPTAAKETGNVKR